MRCYLLMRKVKYTKLALSANGSSQHNNVGIQQGSPTHEDSFDVVLMMFVVPRYAGNNHKISKERERKRSTQSHRKATLNLKFLMPEPNYQK